MDKAATPLMTRAQRKASGKALRAVVSRESHADFKVDPHRDPLPILTACDPMRVAALVPVRYQRMAVSPFAFYRGAAAIMAHDLSANARIGLPVQACGDCHLMNFGAFSSPEGNILFDINDFDETYPGVDFIVDLKRLVASVVVAAQDARMPDKKAIALAKSTVKAYRDFMSYLAGEPPLDVWNTRMNLKDQLRGLGDDNLETEILDTLVKAEKKSRPSREQPGIAVDADGHQRFIDKPPFIYHVGQNGETVSSVFSQKTLDDYKRSLLPERAKLLDQYALKDVAFKVVGVGSVGTYCAIGLMATEDGDTIILQMKQALRSAVESLALHQIEEGQQGRRVVNGQRALQAASDIFLGWTEDSTGRLFYLRQLKNRRIGSISELLESSALPAYATLCGRTLARAHARTGDAAMISGYLGSAEVIDDSLAAFAMAYASQTVLDHAKLVKSSLVPKAPLQAAPKPA